MCLWKVEEWSKQQLNSGPLQPDRRTPCVGDLRVQFRNDKRGLLAVAKSQLAVYDVLNWDRPVAQVSAFVHLIVLLYLSQLQSHPLRIILFPRVIWLGIN